MGHRLQELISSLRVVGRGLWLRHLLVPDRVSGADWSCETLWVLLFLYPFLQLEVLPH